MKKTVCDFCGRDAVDREKTIFKVNGESFRIAIVKVRIQNGVRWVEADTCRRCLKKYLKRKRHK